MLTQAARQRGFNIYRGSAGAGLLDADCTLRSDGAGGSAGRGPAALGNPDMSASQGSGGAAALAASGSDGELAPRKRWASCIICTGCTAMQRGLGVPHSARAA